MKRRDLIAQIETAGAILIRHFQPPSTDHINVLHFTRW